MSEHIPDYEKVKNIGEEEEIFLSEEKRGKDKEMESKFTIHE